VQGDHEEHCLWRPIVDTGRAPAKTERGATRSSSPGLVSKPEATFTDEYADRGFLFSRLPVLRTEILGISIL